MNSKMYAMDHFRDCKIIFVLCIFHFVVFKTSFAKTTNGILSSLEAYNLHGQFISAFCYHGDTGEFKYILESKVETNGHFYFYNEDEWILAKEKPCIEKINTASIKHKINNKTGTQVIEGAGSPHIWYIMYADEYTCGSNMPQELEFSTYVAHMLNPDILGNPTEHFSDEETGLYRFYQLLTLCFFVLGCIYGPRMWETLHTEGPMQLVIQLLTFTLVTQAVISFLMMMHLRAYSKDGIGAPSFDFISEMFDLTCQFVMLYMMLSLSLGRTLGGTYKPIKSFSALTEQRAGQIVTILGILQCLLFIWDQYEEWEQRVYHSNRSLGGTALAVLRIGLAAIVGSHLYYHVSSERSAMKKSFYTSFTKYCMVWYLSYPVMIVLSWLLSPYLRYKIIIMGMVSCQSIAVMLLYRLFLSRSLYWEVSALSSSLLPLKMDKSFGMKLYS